MPSFPKFYNNGAKPARQGSFDHEREATTPHYVFGWIVKKADIYVALNPGREPLETRLCGIRQKMEDIIDSRWGIERDPKYSPSTPEFEYIDEDYIRIGLTWNKSSEVIDRIMADKGYHDECRRCFNNPQAMEMEPAWVLNTLIRVPKGLLPE